MPNEARWVGLKDMIRKLDDIGADSRKAFGQGLRLAGEAVMARAKTNEPKNTGVPVDDGHLKRSGRVKGPKGRDLVVELSFGGPSAPYALVQHERLDFRHTVGEAKYLTRALERVNRNNGITKIVGKTLQLAILKNSE